MQLVKLKELGTRKNRTAQKHSFAPSFDKPTRETRVLQSQFANSGGEKGLLLLALFHERDSDLRITNREDESWKSRATSQSENVEPAQPLERKVCNKDTVCVVGSKRFENGFTRNEVDLLVPFAQQTEVRFIFRDLFWPEWR